MSSKLKKIITGSIEAAKDSARQVASTVSPGKLIEQAIGSKSLQSEDEFSKYLKNLGPNLSKEQLKKKEEELGASDQKELEETRKVLRQTTPKHMMLPQTPTAARPYEVLLQEEEQKKAQAVEARKQQPRPLATPTSKPIQGKLGPQKRTPSSGF